LTRHPWFAVVALALTAGVFLTLSSERSPSDAIPGTTPQPALAAIDPTPPATPVAAVGPGPAPSAGQILALAKELQFEGRHDLARQWFASLLTEASATDVAHEARFQLGRSFLADLQYLEAEQHLALVVALDPSSERRRLARFLLGEALAGYNRPDDAVLAYMAYLEAGGVAESEAWERIAEGRRKLGSTEAAEDAYGRAVLAAPDRGTAAGLREQMAELALDTDSPLKAAAQYDRILETARTPSYRAEIQFRAGEAFKAAGRAGDAVLRYQAAADTDPTSPFAHMAIVALLELQAPVDEYLRGVVDYYNGVYDLAVAALERSISAEPAGRSGKAFDFLGRSYSASGDFQEAITAWDRVIAEFPECPCWGDSWLRRASAQASLGDPESARAGLTAFAASYPGHRLAPEALLRAARLLEEEGDCVSAATAYREVQARYPESQQAEQGLFSSGMCLYRGERWEDAVADWQKLLDRYPSSDLEQAGRLWLGKALLAAGRLESSRDTWHALLESPDSFYAQRAKALALEAGIPLEERPPRSPSPVADGRDGAESWLRSWITEPPSGSLSGLTPETASDPSLERGRELLKLGLREQALEELNRLRLRFNEDPRSLYALSLEFDEIGAYSQSILCAQRLIGLFPGRPEDTPLFVQRLAFPIHYTGLFEDAGGRRDIDPLLLQALARQESLFEAGARSPAGARGLMQIMPPTGEWIASRLGNRDFQVEWLDRAHVSIEFGTYYLRAAEDILGGNLMAALAGYNGGPGNASKWAASSGGDDDRLFLSIAFRESRLYVERILSYYATYRRLYRGAS